MDAAGRHALGASWRRLLQTALSSGSHGAALGCQPRVPVVGPCDSRPIGSNRTHAGTRSQQSRSGSGSNESLSLSFLAPPSRVRGSRSWSQKLQLPPDAVFPPTATKARASLAPFWNNLSSAPPIRSLHSGTGPSRPKNSLACVTSISLSTGRSRLVPTRGCASLSGPLSAVMADRDTLPAVFRPSHYDLYLTNLDLKNWTYNGTVAIDGELTQETAEITLNTLEVKVTEARFDSKHAKAAVSQTSDKFSYDEKKQRCTITFPGPLAPSPKATLFLKFTGIINHDMAGFYRSQYKPAAPAAASVPRDDEYHYMLSTQFEACDARRAFPCFDEPNLKATFDFGIEIPSDQVALSNMPVKESKETPAGKTLVSFERTPLMSTYLLAWAVGDFEYTEAFTDRRYNGKQIPVRVYTTRGLREQGRWALQHAPKIIDYFSEQFEIDYPLPKSDILAVHEFTHGAMENWGLVTYRTTAVLFDEKLSDVRFRNRVAYVVAHELAHQWFGNLVTMDWWDELWLNEGFATWAGWLAIDHLHPEWDVWAQFVNDGMTLAFTLDAIRASHPIHVPVRDALDVNQIFDHISYYKGCSIIRMLANYLGVKTFLKGIAIYLKKHAYRNATTDSLWAALSEASGADVKTLMAPWVQKIGYPVVTVTEQSQGITVKQSRFLSTGDVKPEDDTTTWWIPLALSGKIGMAQGEVDTASLTTKEETIAGVDGEFYQLNSSANGFYQVNYPPERLAQFGKQLGRLNASEKIRIASSASDLAFSGYGSTAALLSFLEGFNSETEYLVLAQALDAVGELKSVFGDDDEIRKGLSAFTLRLIEGSLAKVGFEVPANDEYSSSMLRKRLLVAAVANGHEATRQEAQKRFSAYFEAGDKTAIHADLRTAVYRAGILGDPAKAAQILKKEWYTTAAIDGKDMCLAALGHVQDPKVIEEVLLPFLLSIAPPAAASDSIPPGDVHMLASPMAANRVARPLLWKRIQEGWESEVVAKLGGNPVVLDRFVKLSLSKFTDASAIDEIDAFFAARDTSGFDRTLKTVKDKVRGRAAYRSRDAEALRSWLREKGYARQ
ncbi:aminopeptidase 2 [Magnaporthiopsis poae ATCC 64411]|uniref:Aminopeptidase 2 n=1 Tax=Magnaporthiopsis poae (strain ATCC 64411 / 73-15) TaxID=644358 RepID=A0A0C4EEX8_MAGP6|nr:aminopeptidase 2 [Magnaporthiopsis poae ATCC 64411]